MTHTREKLHSLFLVGLLIGSIFAGTVAITGSAAAADSLSKQGSSLVTPTQASPGETRQHTISFSAENIGTEDTIAVSIDAGSIDSVDSARIAQDASNVDSFSQSGNTVTISPADSAPSSGTISVTLTISHGTSDVQVTVEDTSTSENERLTETISIVSDSRIVRDGDTLYQGEEDYRIYRPNGEELSPIKLERTTGAHEGATLERPIPETQPTGRYAPSGNPDTVPVVTVTTPRVTDFEIRSGSPDGEVITGGSIAGSTKYAYVSAEANFVDSEGLGITVEDETGLDVTGEALANSANTTGVTAQRTTRNASAIFKLNLAALDSGQEYTVTIEGTDDLTSGEASKSGSFTLSTFDDPTISLESDEVTKGENVRFEITGSAEGNIHPVVIEGSSVTGTKTEVFRQVGDTVDVGTTADGDAVALVEINGGVGVGSISTDELDHADTDITVYPASPNASFDRYDVLTDAPLTDPETDTTLAIAEGTINLENPTDTYLVGTDVDINGTTAPGIDRVALYARHEGEYELIVDDILVGSDNRFEREDVDLSDSSDVESTMLGLTGTYRLAAVDAEDPHVTDSQGINKEKLSTSAVSRAVSTETSLQVSDSNLYVDGVSAINGELAVGDKIAIDGTALGQDVVAAQFFGPHGSYVYAELPVDSNGDFDGWIGDIEDNLHRGTVVMTILSKGRDGQIGDGTYDGFNELASEFKNETASSQQQLIERVTAATTNATGSDDRAESIEFRYTDARTSIEKVTSNVGSMVAQSGVSETDTEMVIPIGTNISISGDTNRQPYENTIFVELSGGPNNSQSRFASTDQWYTDGQWEVTINSTQLKPGNYTVKADDGRSSDLMRVRLVETNISASVSMSDQESTGETITVDSVSTSHGGFIAVHKGSAGGDIVGTSEYLDPGSHNDIDIRLSTKLESTEVVVTRVVLDSNNNGEFEFPETDSPYRVNSTSVMDSATISVGTDDSSNPKTDTPDETPETEEPTATQTITEGDNGTSTVTPTSDGTGVGFSVGITLIALIGVAMVIVRHHG